MGNEPIRWKKRFAKLELAIPYLFQFRPILRVFTSRMSRIITRRERPSKFLLAKHCSDSHALQVISVSSLYRASGSYHNGKYQASGSYHSGKYCQCVKQQPEVSVQLRVFPASSVPIPSRQLWACWRPIPTEHWLRYFSVA